MTSICAGMWLGQLSMGPGVPLTQVLTPRLMKVFFSQSQLSVCAVLSAALACCTSVCTLKIPSTGSHTIVWAHKNTVHTGRNGVLGAQKYCALVGMVFWHTKILCTLVGMVSGHPRPKILYTLVGMVFWHTKILCTLVGMVFGHPKILCTLVGIGSACSCGCCGIPR